MDRARQGTLTRQVVLPAPTRPGTTLHFRFTCMEPGVCACQVACLTQASQCAFMLAVGVTFASFGVGRMKGLRCMAAET